MVRVPRSRQRSEGAIEVPIVDVDRLKEQGKRFADGFTPGQKAMTILGVVGVVLMGMFFMKWASSTDYAPLYTGLSGPDAAAVTQKLDAAGVKYKLAGGGGTILVSKNDVYKERVALSAAGLPSGGGDSYALLDKQGITTDEFTRNIDYQRALQGELGRTIQSIDGIQQASVTIQIPKDTVFVGADQQKATAAVLVKTNGGGDLPSDTVTSIVHLVASSIPNMNPDDVTVADANGKILHAPGMDLGAGSGAQLEAKQAYEAASDAQGERHDRRDARPRSRGCDCERQPRHVEVGLDRRELHEPGRWHQHAAAQAEQRSRRT